LSENIGVRTARADVARRNTLFGRHSTAILHQKRTFDIAHGQKRAREAGMIAARSCAPPNGPGFFAADPQKIAFFPMCADNAKANRPCRPLSRPKFGKMCKMNLESQPAAGESRKHKAESIKQNAESHKA
jgi:hypothetical protein